MARRTTSPTRSGRRRLAGIAAILLLLAAACGDDDTSSTTAASTTTAAATTTEAPTMTEAGTMTEAAADPWGLTTVDLPDTTEAIAAAYEAMPAEVAGYARGEAQGEHLLEYGGEGEGMSLWNQDGNHRVVEGGEQSPADFMEFLAGTGELDVIGSALDGDPVWLEASTTVGDESGEQTEYVLLCGHPDGEHVLFFQAYAEEDLDAVVEAFVATVEG